MKKLKIAQIAPLYEKVPPHLYGGTERVVHYITEELVARGHDVTLYASGDSITKAHLRPIIPQALRLGDSNIYNPKMASKLLMMLLGIVGKEASQFDIIHSHIDCYAFSLAQLVRTPCVHTLHGRLDLPQLVEIYRIYKDLNFVSISNAQRTPIPFINWVKTIYHGIPLDLYKFNPNPKNYLAFFGRICPEKRPDWAIQIAKKVGIPLKIAAKIDPNDIDYFNNQIKHLIDNKFIEYIGEIKDEEKSEFLGNAIAMINPIDWPEPFGLAVIESLACGTPVFARPQGSLVELIGDSVGVLHNDIDVLCDRLKNVNDISRKTCREYVENNFSIQRMVSAYVSLYEKLSLS